MLSLGPCRAVLNDTGRRGILLSKTLVVVTVSRSRAERTRRTVLLASVALIGLAGCSGGDGDTEQAATDATSDGLDLGEANVVGVEFDRQESVVVRGHDQTLGYGGRAVIVDLEAGATRTVDQGSDSRPFSESDCP